MKKTNYRTLITVENDDEEEKNNNKKKNKKNKKRTKNNNFECEIELAVLHGKECDLDFQALRYARYGGTKVFIICFSCNFYSEIFLLLDSETHHIFFYSLSEMVVKTLSSVVL